MPIFTDSALDPIDLGDGNVVYIKRRMTYGDQRVLAGALAPTAAAGTPSAPNLAEYLAVLLERNVVRWEGPAFLDEKGRPRAITREALDELATDTAEQIAAEINARNPRRTSPFVTSASATSSSPASPPAEPSTSPPKPSSSASASGTAGPGRSS